MKPRTFNGRVKYFAAALDSMDDREVLPLVGKAGFRTQYTGYTDARVGFQAFVRDAQRSIGEAYKRGLSTDDILGIAKLTDNFRGKYVMRFLSEEAKAKGIRESAEMVTDTAITTMPIEEALRAVHHYSGATAETIYRQVEAEEMDIRTKEDNGPSGNHIFVWADYKGENVFFVDVYRGDPLYDGTIITGVQVACTEPYEERGNKERSLIYRARNGREQLIFGEQAIRYLLSVAEGRKYRPAQWPWQKSGIHWDIPGFPWTKKDYARMIRHFKSQLKRNRRIAGTRSQREIGRMEKHIRSYASSSGPTFSTPLGTITIEAPPSPPQPIKAKLLKVLKKEGKIVKAHKSIKPLEEALQKLNERLEAFG